MIRSKKLGVCIDDGGPHVIEYATGIVKKIHLAPLASTSKVEGDVFKKSESFSYDIEAEQQTHYFEKLKSVITRYDKLLLFGPTNLKVDLYNLLRADNRFAKTSIEIKQTATMTDGQQHDFVKDYFENIQ